jgi:hypothetical protein
VPHCFYIPLGNTLPNLEWPTKKKKTILTQQYTIAKGPGVYIYPETDTNLGTLVPILSTGFSKPRTILMGAVKGVLYQLTDGLIQFSK